MISICNIQLREYQYNIARYSMKNMRFIIYNYVFLALTITQVFCECGRTKLQGHNLIANGLPAELGTFPWHVAIYHVDWASGEIDHICGGSLIAPDLVISAAHCFYKEAEHRMGDAFEYAVAAGKIQRYYYEQEDYAQKSQVRSIHVPDGYTSSERRSNKDIAVIRLHTPFNMTDYVSPVCIDWHNTYTETHLRHGSIGKVMGWGINAEWIPSEVLREIDLPHIPLEICMHGAPKDFLPDLQIDKICAGYLNGATDSDSVSVPTILLNSGSSVCEGDSGGGHSFHSDGRWYLRGVVSASAFPGNGTCNNNYYTAFTNVGHYLDWIREFYYDAEERNPTMDFPTTGSCFLPKQPEGGRFEQHSSGKSSDHAAGSKAPIDSVLIYRCDEGYILLGNDYSICEDEGWTPPPTCVKSCSALRFANGDILCKYNGKIVDCESAMAPGTRATLECRNYYKLSPALKEITCLEGGAWTSPEFQCVPECGIAESMETPLIVNGSSVMHGSFPWHVGIYHSYNNKMNGSGTLIKPDLIVSSAHTFYDSNTKEPYDADRFSVAAGKYYSLYNKSEPYAQTSSIKKIHIHSNYTDNAEYYANDIALLRLETPFTMSKLVRPVCLDRRSGIAEGFPKVGKIPLWGSPGLLDRESFDLYLEVEGRFKERAACRNILARVTPKFSTSDTSCFDRTTDVWLQSLNHFTDGGIYAEKNKTWYLVGFSHKYLSNKINTLFSTNVDAFLSFIIEVERD